MSNIIIYIYNLFHDRRWLFYVLLACSLLFIIAGLYRVRFVEDISGSAEKAGTTRRFDFVVHHFRFAEQLVINLSIADTSAAIGGGIFASRPIHWLLQFRQAAECISANLTINPMIHWFRG